METSRPSIHDPFNLDARAERAEDRLVHSDQYRAIGGTALIRERLPEVHARATQGFLGYEILQDPPYGVDTWPLIVVSNGGPSTPASRHNALSFGGPYRVNYSTDGHPEKPARYTSSFERAASQGHTLFIDPVGTGWGKMLPGQDPAWHMSVQRDIDTSVATLELYKKEFGHTDRPTVLVGSSYAATRMVGMAMRLCEIGDPVKAIVFLAPAMDNRTSFVSFIKRGDSDLPYITGLPALATSNNYYRRFSYHGPRTEEETLKHIAQYAMGPYAEALRKDREGGLNIHERRRVLSMLSLYTSLPAKLIDAHNMRISPDVFAENYFEHSVLSTFDTRVQFPLGTKSTIDPLLDEAISANSAVIEHFGATLGYPSFAQGEDYTDIVPLYDCWDFTGWEGENLVEPMAQLLGLQPDIRIADITGFYDLNVSPPRSRIFWDSVHQLREGDFRLEHHDIQNSITTDIMPRPGGDAGVDTFVLPMGHQLNHDRKARLQLWSIISKLISSASPPAPRRYEYSYPAIKRLFND